jgi:hypothetical protein
MDWTDIVPNAAVSEFEDTDVVDTPLDVNPVVTI